MPEANIHTKNIEHTDTRKALPQHVIHFSISSQISSKRILMDNIFWIHFELFCYFYSKNENQENFGYLAYIYAKYQISIYSQTSARLDGWDI